MVRPVESFQVRPAIPARLATLEELALNIRWSWDHATIALFRRLDRDLWEETQHNPVAMLARLSQERLKEAAEDEAFLAHLDRVKADLEQYMSGSGAWYRRSFGFAEKPLYAYFSMEFGLTECLPIYSGGLGILAGDHLKSASDLGIPLVGVGLLYQKGYFRQYLNPDGWQQERYPINDFYMLPVSPLKDAEGQPIKIQVDLAGRPLFARLWKAQVGRVMLVLLDTNIPENPRDLQDITNELYGGNLETRIRQEILLGIGGVRALSALGIEPRVFHMNEGHCAFLLLERGRQLVQDHGLTIAEAREVVAASSIFTTHTPVPAGIDVFPHEMIERYFYSFRTQMGVDLDRFLDIGRVVSKSPHEPFNMAVLAIHGSSFVNGVSRLHAEVSRRMWANVWPHVPDTELPITHVTNGIHPESWISQDMRDLYDRYLGPRWAEEPGDTRTWSRSADIPGEELWRTHERRRERLVAFARRRLADQRRRRGAGVGEISAAEGVLNPEALTIGFARRFATYKRATLLLYDPERLEKIVNAAGRTVQFIFAGKAHPQDGEGKALIRQIVQLSRRPEFRRRIVFLEDYDATVARYLVQGVDVWLNNPRRPMEASGTSGMKAAFNGALNLSVLDGWWDEGWSPRTGWAIGRGEEYSNSEEQDRVEASTLYDLLEREVVPLFYKRGEDGMPRGWIQLMKGALTSLCPVFNTNRMVHQYTIMGYRPAQERRDRMEANGFARSKNLAAWRQRIRANWGKVRIDRVESQLPKEIRVGGCFEVRAFIHTGELDPADLKVEAYLGRLDENREICTGQPFVMAPMGDAEQGGRMFRAVIPWNTSGMQGITVRVLPRHDDLAHPQETGLILWAAP